MWKKKLTGGWVGISDQKDGWERVPRRGEKRTNWKKEEGGQGGWPAGGLQVLPQKGKTQKMKKKGG